VNPGFGFLFVTAFAWGLNWPVMKLLMLEWPVYSFRILAGGGAVALLFAIARWQGHALLPPRGQWGRVAAGGLLNVSAWSLVAPLALFWIDASEAAIIAYTMPVWATVLAWPVLGERPTVPRLAGLALGLSGVVLLMAGQVSAAALWEKLPGVGFILLTALMFASGTVVTKRWPVAMPALPLVAWQLVLGLAPVVVIGLLFERVEWSRITWLGWGCLVYVGGIAQVLAYLAWFAALKRLPAGVAATGSLLVPVIGVLSSGLVLGEPLGARHALALALTLGGVVLAGRR
jgi:drug/metabolite transporter (DMT)-like permease